MTIKVVPLGAGQDVGRSCVLVSVGGKNIMFDCGMRIIIKYTWLINIALINTILTLNYFIILGYPILLWLFYYILD
jgi:predicted metal-dependent RNase